MTTKMCGYRGYFAVQIVLLKLLHARIVLNGTAMTLGELWGEQNRVCRQVHMPRGSTIESDTVLYSLPQKNPLGWPILANKTFLFVDQSSANSAYMYIVSQINPP